MPPPLKIDFLTSSMDAGGAQRVVSSLANYLAEKDYEIRIITFRGEDKYELNDKIKRVKLHKMPLVNSVILNGFFSLLLFYRKKVNQPDIISSHVDLLGYISIPIRKIYNLRLILSEHSNHLAEPSFPKKVLWKFLYPFADAITILTKFDLDFFSKRNKKVIIMPNPSSFNSIEQGENEIKRNQDIVAIGDLDRYNIKGFDNLIDIASNVLPCNKEWKLKIIGNGSYGLEILQKKVKSYGLEERIIFTGYREDIRRILVESEIFILSSRSEGLPMVLIEAMSQGTACIAYDCISGPSDIMTNNYDGILVENQNLDKMIEKLNELINNKALRETLRTNSPNSIKKFSLENIGKKWENLLWETIEQP